MTMEEKFQIKSDSKYLPGLRSSLRKLMEESGFSEKEVGELSLCVDEALTNVIRHGYDLKGGEIEIFYRDLGDKIEILIRDFGKLFDPTSLPTPELPPKKPGGLGVHFMKTLMDEVHYRVGESSSNELSLVKSKS